MSTVTLTVSQSGQLTEERDQQIYSGSNNNVRLHIRVPRDLLMDHVYRPDTKTGSIVTISGTGLNREGVPTGIGKRSLRYIGRSQVGPDEFFTFERKLPNAFTYYSGNYTAPITVKNVMVDEYGRRIEQITASSVWQFTVLQGTMGVVLPLDDPSQMVELEARVTGTEMRMDDFEQDNADTRMIADQAIDIANEANDRSKTTLELFEAMELHTDESLLGDGTSQNPLAVNPDPLNNERVERIAADEAANDRITDLAETAASKVALSAEVIRAQGVEAGLQSEINPNATNLANHTANSNNPHQVTATQVGAATPTDVTGAINAHNTSEAAHTDIRTIISNLAFVESLSVDTDTDTVTFIMRDGTTQSLNFGANVDIQYNDSTKEIIITNSDGTESRVDISSLVPVYTGSTGTQIQVTITNNAIEASIIAGTITSDQLSNTLNNLIANKQNLVPTAADGNIATFDATGQVEDSGIPISDLATDNDLATEITRAKEAEGALATDLGAANTNLNNHINDTNNPHYVTAAQVGLGNVDNTADIDKPVSTAQQGAIDAHNIDPTAHDNLFAAKANMKIESEAYWLENNPVLTMGAFGYDSTNGKAKVGDGVRVWDKLSWIATAPFIKPIAPFTYGVAIDTQNSDPETSVTYTDDAAGFTPAKGNNGNYIPGSMDTKYPFDAIKPCLFKNGNVVGYLNPNNRAEWLDNVAPAGQPVKPDITSGNGGDVMGEIPHFYYSIARNGNIINIKISNIPDQPGFTDFAFSYKGVVKEKFYLGAYLGSNDGTKLRSLSGAASDNNKTIGAFRTLAQANGAGYEQFSFNKLTAMQILYLLWFKNRDSQTALGRGYVDSSGNYQTNGYTDTKGLNYGTGSGNVASGTTTNDIMSFAGLENFWGNRSQWADGLVSGTRAGSTLPVYINDGNFQDNGQGAGYKTINVPNTANISGYMTDIQGNNDLGFVTNVGGGSTTTHYCDSGNLNSGSYVPSFGGNAGYASYAGAFQLYVYNATSYANANIGARLTFCG